MVRGSVIWVARDPARGAEIPKTRPCVIVSREIANEVSETVTVVPLSSLTGEIMRRIDRGLFLHLKLEEYVRTWPEQG